MANAAAGRAVNKSKFLTSFAKLGQFLRESYTEVVKKASWPTWSELKKSTVVVVVAIVIVDIWVGGLDFIFSRLTQPLFSGLASSR